MDYLEIYELSGDIDDIIEKLVGYIGKDEHVVIVKNLVKDIDLMIFDRPIEKRFAEDNDGILSDHVEILQQNHKEWLKYLGENLHDEENLDIEYMASEIKTADKLP